MDNILNWLWQGCVVAAASGVLLRLLHRSRAQFRYVLCWIVLVIVLALPILPWLSFPGVGSSLAQPGMASEPIEAMIWVPNTWWTSATIALSVPIYGLRVRSSNARSLIASRGACAPMSLLK